MPLSRPTLAPQEPGGLRFVPRGVSRDAMADGLRETPLTMRQPLK
jgi:hypothetical protein